MGYERNLTGSPDQHYFLKKETVVSTKEIYLCAICLHDQGPSASSTSSKTSSSHMAIHRNLHRPYFQYVGFVSFAPNKALENLISLEQFDSHNLALASV